MTFKEITTISAATSGCNSRGLPPAGMSRASAQLSGPAFVRQLKSCSVTLQDNNVIALGLEDAVVAIYNVRLDVVQHSMKSHDAAVTGAACCCCARRRGDGHMSNGSNGSLCAGLAFVGTRKAPGVGGPRCKCVLLVAISGQRREVHRGEDGPLATSLRGQHSSSCGVAGACAWQPTFAPLHSHNSNRNGTHA